jgi:ParB/RepB/Spo0J family partition protein
MRACPAACPGRHWCPACTSRARAWTKGALYELAESIKAQGIMQPILVRRLVEGENAGKYEIIAGERRFRAARLAGLDSVPVLVRDVPNEAAAAMALIENIQREDLNPLEEAQGLQRLVKEFGLTHEQAAQAVGRSRSAASNLLRLLNLAEPVQTMLMAGDIDMGHARALLALDRAAQITAGNQIAAKKLSVREAEAWSRRSVPNSTWCHAKTQKGKIARPQAGGRRTVRPAHGRGGSACEKAREAGRAHGGHGRAGHPVRFAGSPQRPDRAPARTSPSEPGEVPQEYEQHKPKGRILIYWGCGSEVRAGQPRVIDLARAKPSDFAVAFAGRAVPDRGARVGPSHALYPNERNQVQLSRESSLVGEHQIRGEGVPVSMKFTLGSAQDLMPAIALRTSGKPQDSMGTNWEPVRNARAYYLHAMSQNGDDMVMWSSAETPDTGMGLFDYLPNATIDRWVKERVLLPADATQCAIPKGIFAAGAGRESTPMLRMMAYGGESHIVHPPRPADPKAPWEPEWSVRVRVKAHTMAMLGEEQGGGAMHGVDRSDMAEPAEREEGGAGAQPANPVNPINVLRGVFGR